MGFPIMMGGEEATYILLEVHYDNSQYHPGIKKITKSVNFLKIFLDIFDSSGMRLYMTQKQPSTEIGTMTIAMGTDPEMLLIPPGQSSFKHYTFCSPACTEVP